MRAGRSEQPEAGFGAALSARLRHLSDPISILEETARALGQHLEASRVGYAEVDPTGETLVVERDWTNGTMASIAGRHPLLSFGSNVIASHAAGETWIMADAEQDPRLTPDLRTLYVRLGLVAVVTVPLVKDGKLVALLSVHQGSPRRWIGTEVALVEEVAERSWAAVERARAEADRRESRALLAAIMEHAPIGIYLKDVEGRYVAANPEMATLFDRPLSEILGRSAADLFGEDYAHAIGIRDRAVLSAGHAIATEEHLPGAARYEWTLVMRFPVRTAPDAPVRVGGFDIDITPQKHAEEELRRSREALYQSEKLAAFGSLLAGVSHELNNPLSIIAAQATMLEIEAEGTRFGTRAAKIRQAAERSGRIVQTFLAMARQKSPERTSVDPNALVRSALELADYGLRTAGVTVATDLAPTVPHITGDADQLHQVLINLIINAQHALQEKEGARELLLSTRTGEGGTVEIEVRDSGPGVSPADRRRIFEPFYTTKPEGAGTGVGLSFSQGVVEAHGGTLELLDRTFGATFLVRLPVARAGGGDGARGPVPASASEKLAVLVVDDEVDLAESLADILALEGVDVSVAAGGRQARALLTQRSFDVILSDLRMPDLDGPALFAWIEAQRPEMSRRIGFVTGDTLSAAAVRFLARTGCPFAEKPFTRESIGQLVAEIVGRAGERE